jgi:hypothetical protein
MANERTERLFLVAIATVVMIVGGSLLAQNTNRPHQTPNPAEANVAVAGKSAPRFPVVVSRPEGAPRIASGNRDIHGRELTVSCASCHANLVSHAEASGARLPKTFHQGLQFQHGKLHCVSCHNPPNYSELRTADGHAVDFGDVQSLCGQCHSLQSLDYEHGAQGGMNGYWDLGRGPRQRKGCIDCHDPHAPAFPSMVPTFKPFDRFLPRTATGHDDD